jgi:UDP-N-acetylmuramoyl-tripeptide--D-alanyl-D-alanine ligase
MDTVFSGDDLSRAAGGTMTRPFHVSGISIDTRTCRPGELFVALLGEHGDGHNFVADALARGAAGAMVHRQDGLPDDAPLLVVGDTLAGLAALGAFARERFEGAVIAVTGSVGKTTTKEMLLAVLGASGRTHAAFASYNNHWGVPLTLARMPPECDYAIIEIGMNHPGEIAPLAKLAAPDIAVITAVEAAHIGPFGSLEAIAAEKASILDGVLQGGCAVLPGDSPMLPVLAARAGAIRSVIFGSSQIEHVSLDDRGSDVIARIDGKRVEFRLGAPGLHMVMNALAALSACAAIGADVGAGATALAGFTAISGRGARMPILGGSALLLDESYNASGASVRAALALLKLLPAKRRIAILGDMLELGGHSEAEHAALAGPVGESADLLYACGPWMKFLYEMMPPERQGAYAADSEGLAALVAGAVRPGDAVLVKGSLGSRMRVVSDCLAAAAEAG